MKIYHVETQQAYDELMSEFEEKGYKWLSGQEPTAFNYWKSYKENTCIKISGKDIAYRDIERCKKQHPNIPIIEYRAKGENMTQEEMKHKLQEVAYDVSVAIESFSRDMSEADLKEAKSSAKKLIEKIDEYSETLNSGFKVGDYVTYESVVENKIAKIDSIIEDELHGLWYEQENEGIRQDWWLKGGHTVRHATPEEIAEYEVALTFHKHGRKPFEVKDGDLLENKFGRYIANGYSFSKEDFIVGSNTFLKAVEEVNEWLENK